MFEKEIQFITDFNLNKIKRLGSFFTLEDLTKAKIHPAIVQYISAEIDYLIYLDRQNLMQKSVFDYSGSEIIKHFLAISSEIKKNKLLPYEEVKKIIQQAVSFHLTYLLRPVWTLKKFVFDTSETRSQEEVKLFFNYIYFYDYYKKIFLTILEKKQLVTISIYEFESLLEKIQVQLLEQQRKNVLENALIDMAEFLSTGEVTRTRLSIETLEIFLKDKKLHEQIYKVRKLLSVDPKQKFELSEIKAALFSSISVEYEEEPLFESPKNEAQLDIFQSAEEALHEEHGEAEALLNSLQAPFIGEQEAFKHKAEEEMIAEPEAEIQIEKFEEQETIYRTDESLDSELDNLDTVEASGNELSTEKLESLLEESDDEEYLSETETKSFLEEEIPTAEEKISEYGALEEEDSFNSNTAIENEIANNSFAESVDGTEKEKEIAKMSFEEYFKEELKKTESPVEENSYSEPEVEEESQQPGESTVDEIDGTEPESEIDIFSYFTTKETMKIIGGIFNNDSLDFVNTLESIAACSKEDEADQILKDVFLSYRVNSVGKEAALLKEKVEQFFRDKEF